MKKRLSSLLFLILISVKLFSQTHHNINVSGMSFSPDTLICSIGDTITINIGGYHNAIEVSDSTWINNGILSNNGFNFPLGTPSGTFVIDTLKTYYYVCTPHVSLGMKGVIIVNPVATYGCTDSNATNFDPLANIDDGSCQYDSTCITFALFDIGGHLFVEHTGCMPNNFNTGYAHIDTTGMGGSGSYNFGWYDDAGQLLDSSLLVSNLDTGNYVINIEDVGCVITLTYSFSITYNYGCMDSMATNYDPLATCDDGCVYPLPPSENLFFSEHAEGSSNNKYFEVYNPTSDTVDLANYAFAIVNNSPTTIGVYEYWVDFDSGAVILPNDVYVVAHPSADPFILAEADMDYGSLSNGDDGIALVYGIEPSIASDPSSGSYELLDWIGNWNGDPGQGWDVAGTNAATRNHTLVRKCPIFHGDTSWLNAAGTDPVNSQWIVFSQNDWTNIGFHNTCVCDSTTNSYTSIIDTLCSGLSIIVGNNTYDSTGVYYDTLLAFNGCDSIITTNLTVLNTSAYSVINDITICDGDSVIVGNSVYSISGTFVDVLTNSSGCDSTITTNITVQTPVNQNITICYGDSLIVGNSVYNTSGIYVDTIISSIGCDSIVTTYLTIYSQFNPIYGGIPNNTVGGGSFYSGSQYLEMSCYLSSELISAVVYAEDTVTETFEVRDLNGNVLSDTLVTVIPGGHRVYFNYQMTPGTDYQLGVNGNSNALFRNNSGVSYPYNFGSLASVTSSSAGGNYYYFYYDIEIRQTSQPTNYSICDGDSVVIAGNVYTTTGLYIDSLTSSIGCDSLVFTNLMAYPNANYTNNQTICSGEIYVIGGNMYDSTGVYTDSLYTQFGCDSIVTTILFVDTILGGSSVNNQSICLGDSITVGSSVYYNDGTYQDTLISSNGCDSIVLTNLTIVSSNYATFIAGLPDTSTAPGDFSGYNGYLNINSSVPNLIKSATVYSEDTNSVTFELRDNNGVVLDAVTHIVYPGAQSLIFNFMVPVGNDYQLGVSASNSGLYRSNAGTGNSLPYPFDIGTFSITGANSNFSTQYYYFFYDIEIMPFATNNKKFICEGDSVIVGSSTYDTPGTYVDTVGFSSFGCDSVVYTTLDFYQSPLLAIQSYPSPAEICLGDTVVLEGTVGFDAYWWSDINGNIILVNNRLVDNPTIDTLYLLSAKDSNGCTVSEDIWVYVDSCISGFNNNIFSRISVYPNPSYGLLNIDITLEKNQDFLIRITNSLGEIVYSQTLLNTVGQVREQIDLQYLPKGVYFLDLKTKEGMLSKKLILN